MNIITLQLSKLEKATIEKAQEALGFRSRSEYIRQAVMKQAKKDIEEQN